MPIKWYGTSDNNNPTYKHFSRIVNFVLHAMAFSALNSGLWFWQQIRHPWPHLSWFSEFWLLVLFAHLALVISQRPVQTKDESESSV